MEDKKIYTDWFVITELRAHPQFRTEDKKTKVRIIKPKYGLLTLEKEDGTILERQYVGAGFDDNCSYNCNAGLPQQEKVMEAADEVFHCLDGLIENYSALQTRIDELEKKSKFFEDDRDHFKSLFQKANNKIIDLERINKLRGDALEEIKDKVRGCHSNCSIGIQIIASKALETKEVG